MRYYPRALDSIGLEQRVRALVPSQRDSGCDQLFLLWLVQRDVIWSVARLAANINLIIGRRVLPALGVVALYDIGAVALCTPTVPVVVDAGPVQRAF